MQKNSINRNKIEWDSFRSTTIEYADGAKIPKDTYPAIKFALKNLGDNHSFFKEPETYNKISINFDPFYIKVDERIQTRS